LYIRMRPAIEVFIARPYSGHARMDVYSCSPKEVIVSRPLLRGQLQCKSRAALRGYSRLTASHTAGEAFAKPLIQSWQAIITDPAPFVSCLFLWIQIGLGASQDCRFAKSRLSIAVIRTATPLPFA
jgi:hypothetical protein